MALSRIGGPRGRACGTAATAAASSMTTTTTTTTTTTVLRSRQQRMPWSNGNFGKIARFGAVTPIHPGGLSQRAAPAVSAAAAARKVPPARSLGTTAVARAGAGAGAGGRSAPTSGIVQYRLTDVGEGIAECELLKWHVRVGDRVRQFDKVCEVQSDKANVEITSRFDGIVRKLYYEKGQLAKVGTPLLDIDLSPDSSTAAAAGGTTSAVAPTGAVAGGGGGEGGGGGDALLSSPSAGGGVMSSSVATAASSESAAIEHAAAAMADNGGGGVAVLATPAVRRIAKESGVNLREVSATGRDGRVMKEDILGYLASRTTTTTTPTTPSSIAGVTPSPPLSSSTVGAGIGVHVIGGDVGVGLGAEVERVPVRGLMRTMVKTMSASAAVPQLGFMEEVRMDALMTLRQELRPAAERAGFKLTFMPFLIKATSLAAVQYPIVNASLSSDGTEVIYKRRHNVGVAMDSPAGLLVPNIKDVQARSLFDIARELNRLQRDGAANKLTAADLSGGTLTLSNIGTIGGTYTVPVLLPPESIIAGIGRTQKLPRFDDKGQLHAVHIMNVSWSADHRIIDGATVANFAMLVKRFLEQPALMVAYMK